MLTITKLLKKTNLGEKSSRLPKKGSLIRVHRRDIPMNKEWANSIYRFNKNSMRILPSLSASLFNLIKQYFSITYNFEKKTFGHNNILKKHNSTWISNPEIKYWNHKINITIYTYNKLYNVYKKKLDCSEFIWGPITYVESEETNLQNISNDETKKISEFSISEKTRLLKQQFATYFGRKKSIYDNSINHYTDTIKWLKIDKHDKLMEDKSNVLAILETNDAYKLSDFSNQFMNDYYEYLLLIFKKELTYIKLKQKILYNKFKYNELYLTPLLKFIKAIYGTNVDINIVALKYYYLNSSILSQILNAKITNSKYRGRSSIPVNYALDKVKIPILSRTNFAGEGKPFVGTQNVIFNKDATFETVNVDKFILKSKSSQKYSNKEDLVLANLENKAVSGIFIKLAGRLTRRYKAQRAIQTIKFKGTLQNVYSSHRRLSSGLSRGYANINVEKTTLNSKIRIGSFGLTGWVASY